jgi:hypothetical protein
VVDQGDLLGDGDKDIKSEDKEWSPDPKPRFEVGQGIKSQVCGIRDEIDLELALLPHSSTLLKHCS